MGKHPFRGNRDNVLRFEIKTCLEQSLCFSAVLQFYRDKQTRLACLLVVSLYLSSEGDTKFFDMQLSKRAHDPWMQKELCSNEGHEPWEVLGRYANAYL